MKNYEPFIVKSVHIIKIPSLYFIQKISKTFTRKTKTKFMFSLIVITLIILNKRTNKATINMSSHNLKLSSHWELILLFECEIVFYFCL